MTQSGSVQKGNGGGPEQTHSGRFTELDPNKLRGGYYTSSELARWLAVWAIRKGSDTVLEPSCGDGAFLEAVAGSLSRLQGGGSAFAKNLFGIEIIATEAAKARARLRPALGHHADDVIETGDFFSWWLRKGRPEFDAVIGNPPFIRYQTFPEPHRGRAMAIMAELGLTPNRLTNIWVPFVAAAAAATRPGGRLALVLPAELLQVTYASQLRSFLTDRFARLDIVACNELFFDNAEQEVILLLADGAQSKVSVGTDCRVTLTETRTVAEIVSRTPDVVLAGASPKVIRHDDEKWLKYFLTEIEIAFMRELRTSKMVTVLKTHAAVDVGVVTGKNEFFVLTTDQVNALNIHDFTMPLVSRSAHLKGARIKRSEWKGLAASGDRVHLLHLAPVNGSKLPASLRGYIRAGETKKIHKGYKCSIRAPWYAVPSVWIPAGFVFRQIYDFPRVVLNQARATSTDTIHRLSCKANSERVIASTYTYLTAASAEIEGRSYGGGVLELEPTEAERLLVPADLSQALPLEECDELIRVDRLDEVLAQNSRRVLMGQMGLSMRECNVLRGVWNKMRNRRLARRRGPRKPRLSPSQS